MGYIRGARVLGNYGNYGNYMVTTCGNYGNYLIMVTAVGN